MIIQVVSYHWYASILIFSPNSDQIVVSGCNNKVDISCTCVHFWLSQQAVCQNRYRRRRRLVRRLYFVIFWYFEFQHFLTLFHSKIEFDFVKVAVFSWLEKEQTIRIFNQIYIGENPIGLDTEVDRCVKLHWQFIWPLWIRLGFEYINWRRIDDVHYFEWENQLINKT